MPSFFQELRRRSKSSKTRDSQSSSDSNSNNDVNPTSSNEGGTVQSPLTQNGNKSTSTLSSIFGSKPPSQPQSPPLGVTGRSPSGSNLASINGGKTPPLGSRPSMSNHNPSSRYSLAVCLPTHHQRQFTSSKLNQVQGSSMVNGGPKATSPLAPQLNSISENSWVGIRPFHSPLCH